MPDSIDIASLKIPTHVAFIMDGNGRWATSRGLPRIAGHRAGVEAVERVLECAQEWGIRWISLYAFSTENWRRPEAEVALLFSLLSEYVNRELERFVRDGVRIHVLGEIERLPSHAKASLEKAMDATKDLDELHLLVAVNYGGRDELLRAARRWADDGAPDVTEDSFPQYLDSGYAPDPDVLIRTSGEQRISNFLLWQVAYAEFVFVDDMWPDFDAEVFTRALTDFDRRRRRFGATDEQLEEV